MAMMTDNLVFTLRHLTRFGSEHFELLYQAADEIDRLLDEIDRLRAIIQLAIDLGSDDENRDEMSSDAEEWCNDMIAILNGAF
jgi:hypothetical protein